MVIPSRLVLGMEIKVEGLDLETMAGLVESSNPIAMAFVEIGTEFDCVEVVEQLLVVAIPSRLVLGVDIKVEELQTMAGVIDSSNLIAMVLVETL